MDMNILINISNNISPNMLTVAIPLTLLVRET